MRGNHQTLTVREAPQRARYPNNNSRSKLKTKAPSAAMSRVQQQTWARPFDWDLHRDFITQLYMIDDYPLKEVERIMREQFQFHAT